MASHCTYNPDGYFHKCKLLGLGLWKQRPFPSDPSTPKGEIWARQSNFLFSTLSVSRKGLQGHSTRSKCPENLSYYFLSIHAEVLLLLGTSHFILLSHKIIGTTRFALYLRKLRFTKIKQCELVHIASQLQESKAALSNFKAHLFLSNHSRLKKENSFCNAGFHILESKEEKPSMFEVPCSVVWARQPHSTGSHLSRPHTIQPVHYRHRLEYRTTQEHMCYACQPLFFPSGMENAEGSLRSVSSQSARHLELGSISGTG